MARGGKRAGAGRKPNAAGKKAREVSDLTHGGRRAGAGRTLGAATKKTLAIADKAAADGNITPLEVMLNVMRAALLDGNLPLAVSIACARIFTWPSSRPAMASRAASLASA